MKRYQQLSSTERFSLCLMYKRGYSMTEIAEVLDRHRSTIYRELKRNTHPQGFYCPKTAGRLTQQRRKRPSPKQSNRKLQKFVERNLHKGWSPEIIAGRLKYLNKSFRSCTETLYRLIYSAPGQNRGWPGLLSLARPRRTPIRAKKRIRYLKFTHISERPQAATERLEFGHWEGDSVHFTKSKNERHVTTLIERKSRYALGILQSSTRSNVVMNRIKDQLHDQPVPACKSLTLDQGTEFSYFQVLERRPKHGRRRIKTYYCNPKSPWQKGGVENFNLRLRRYLPRAFNIQHLTAAELNKIIRTMNRTPRKCLGFKTPQEVYTSECRS